jgi:hypothetical protein
VFGIENFWGCKTQRCAGLIGSATNDFYYKLTHGTKDGTEATSFNTNGAGYHVVENGQAADGWIKNKSFGKYGMIAKVVDESASSTTYYCSTFTPGKIIVCLAVVIVLTQVMVLELLCLGVLILVAYVTVIDLVVSHLAIKNKGGLLYVGNSRSKL